MRYKSNMRQLDQLQKQACDYPACTQLGSYPAPRSAACNAYYWFCLEHVKNYNRTWNFFKDMTEAEIEYNIRSDTVWRRPTWPIGVVMRANSQHKYFAYQTSKVNLFGFFPKKKFSYQEKPSFQGLTGIGISETRAMHTMGLQYPLTRSQVKERYKELVKQLHPDMNGGNRVTEEALKVVIDAYKLLMRSLK